MLYAQNADTEMPMASLTKMMTALVALRDWHDEMSRPMTVPSDVKQIYGEVIYLQPGEVYTFQQLLQAMLLDSANDAAVAIAVNVAGSQAAFVDDMNQEAKLLGLTETHFANVHGLDAPDHYSSAHDLAILGAAAMTDPNFRQTVAMRQATIPWPVKNSVRQLNNINRLLDLFPGATGIKTGYTTNAMNCVVGSANANGHEIIAVVMGEGPYWVWRDESAFLSYGMQADQGVQAPTAPTLPMVVHATAAMKAQEAAVLATGPTPTTGTGRGPWPLVAGVVAAGGLAAAVQRRRRARRWRWKGWSRRPAGLPRAPRLEPIPHSRLARHD